MALRSFRWIVFLLLVSMAGCTGLPFQPGGRPQTSPATTENAGVTQLSPTPAGESTVSPTSSGDAATSTPGSDIRLIRIWLPPEFDPEGGSPAAGILKERLQEFTRQNPGINLEIRIKALEGTGGLLDELVTANAAAPEILPDLVLLPRPLLEAAGYKGLLYPYNGLTDLMQDQAWFEYARQLSHLKDSIYGIPFAGDTMAVVYKPSYLAMTPRNLEGLSALGEVLLYPAADSQSLFTLCMYLSAGGSVQDEQGRPELDTAILTDIFEYDQMASLAGVMPYTITQYTDETQVWETFMGGNYPMAVSWASSYLQHNPDGTADLSIAPLPTPDGTPFTLATGWSWALAGKDVNRRGDTVRLVEFLSDKDFLAEWNRLASMLPPRVDSLQEWQDVSTQRVLEQVSYSAQLMPSEDLISTIGPALKGSLIELLKAQSDPESAARAVILLVNQP